MKKALMLGNYVARYHSAEGVEKRLRELLPDYQMDYSESLSSIEGGNLSGYQLFISYLEFGAAELNDEQTKEVLTYVAQGGSLLVLHNGISLQTRPEFAQLVGAKFTHHPDYIDLPQIDYKVVAPEHPVMAGIGDFSMGDEPYQFIMDPLAELTMLLEYEYEEERWPAAWIRGYGCGQVAYFANGHNAEGFANASFSRILQNVVGWFAAQ